MASIYLVTIEQFILPVKQIHIQGDGIIKRFSTASNQVILRTVPGSLRSYTFYYSYLNTCCNRHEKNNNYDISLLLNDRREIYNIKVCILIIAGETVII